jgi:hypothetical protein
MCSYSLEKDVSDLWRLMNRAYLIRLADGAAHVAEEGHLQAILLHELAVVLILQAAITRTSATYTSMLRIVE